MISVIIPTYNGGETLPLMLDALCKVLPPKSGCEYVFIDNGSTDSSAAIIQEFQDRLPIKLISEKQQGKNYAVSAGLDIVKGDLILFTDDDVIPDETWLLEYEGAADTNPDVSVFSGQVRHFWKKKPSAWLEQLAADGMAFGGTAANRAEGPIQAIAVKGANFMVRKHIVKQFRFNTDIGPNSSGNYAAGSETEYLLRVEQAGNAIHFVPKARILHIVLPHEMSLRSILKRYYRIGRGMSVTGVKAFPADSTSLFGYPRFVFKKIIYDFLLAFRYGICGNGYQAVRKLMSIAIIWGRADMWKKSKLS